MSQASDFLESSVLFHIFKGNAYTVPPEIAVGLVTSPVSDSDTGVTAGTFEPAAANGYARQRVSAANWTYSHNDAEGGSISGKMTSAATITFGPCTTADWSNISGIIITDSGVRASGNLLFRGTLTTPKVVGVGDSLSISAGNLDIFLG